MRAILNHSGRVAALVVALISMGRQALADEALAPGRAAGSPGAAAAPLAPGKAAGVRQAQGLGQSGILIIGLGGIVVAGAVLVLSGGGGGSQNGPRNFSQTATATSP
jgi:hypothetical protein